MQRMRVWSRLPIALTMLSLASNILVAQQVVRVTDADAIDPAEVTIAINPKNPDNIVAASFQAGRPPRPRAGSYNYLSIDGGKTWKTTIVENPKNLTQGDDTVYFGSDGSVYHAHLSFAGIRVARPPRAENGILIEASPDGGATWNGSVPVINHINSVTPFEDKPGTVLINPLEHVDYAATIATRDLSPNKVFICEVFFPQYPELRIRQKFLTAP